MNDVDLTESALWHDYERETARAEYLLEFMQFLRMEQRESQNAVKALYPRLYGGVSVQEIKETLDKAIYWRSIPDDWAERYADERVELRFDFEEKFWHHTGIELWIETELDVERLRSRLEDEPEEDGT